MSDSRIEKIGNSIYIVVPKIGHYPSLLLEQMIKWPHKATVFTGLNSYREDEFYVEFLGEDEDFEKIVLEINNSIKKIGGESC